MHTHDTSSGKTPHVNPPYAPRSARTWRTTWIAYLLAVSLPLAALLVRLAIGFRAGDAPAVVLFVLPITIGAALGGLGPGLSATLVAALVTDYVLLTPVESFAIKAPLQLGQWAALIVSGVFISMVCEALHRALERAEAHEQLQSVTLASIGDAVITTDSQGRVTFLNYEAERLTGWSQEGATGRPLGDVFHIVDAQGRMPVDDPVTKVLRTGLVVGLANHTVVISRDGRETPIDDSGAPIRQADGVIRGVVMVFRDVAAREQAAKVQAHLAAIVESSDDAIISKDLHSTVLSWNDSAARLFGYAAEEMIGQSITRIIPADRQHEEELILARMRNGEKIEHFETVRQHKDGTPIDVSVTISPIRDLYGAIVGASKVVRDIRARKRAEAALRSSEARFTTAFHANPAAMAITRLRDGLIIDVNASYEHQFGFSRTELIGRQTSTISLYTDPNQRAAIVNRLHEQGSLQNAETTIRTKSGELRDVLFSMETVELDGELCILSSVFDITDRKRAEAALRVSEERLQRYAERLQHLRAIDQAILAHHSPAAIAQATIGQIGLLVPNTRVAVILIDMAARTMTLAALCVRGELQPVAAPPAALELLGDFLNPLQHGEVYQIADVSALPSVPPLVRLARAEDLRAIFIAPIVADGELVGTVNVGSDAPDAFSAEHIEIASAVADQLSIAIQQARLQTQIERHAQELEQQVISRTAELRLANSELARAARLKDEFLASMSHELRTPLNAILGRAEALDEAIYGPVTERQRVALKTIDESGRHLLALITDILDLSKVTAGKLSLEIEETSVAIMCQACLRMIAQTAIGKQIKVSAQLDYAVDMIRADVRRLKQILVNLLSNAVKFTPNGGEIGLEVVGDPVRQRATFTVWDTGIGIASEDLPKLFQPFVQIDSSLNRQYAGTGLGLALVQRLAEAHGGSVALESTPGAGSRFSVTLPWEPGVPEIPMSVSAPSIERPRDSQVVRRTDEPLILIADDNELNSSILRDYLEVSGYQVDVAQDGGEALAQARERRPALILMDIQMPGIDGMEAIRRMRADPSLRDIPIIALTALAMPGDREQCLEAGADAYLAKPVGLRELLKLIETRIPFSP
jgi:PAS domain S-box-containing protein